ncbi:MAG: PEP-CTERM sorting domain-containing protein [Crocosphaera sp.]
MTGNSVNPSVTAIGEVIFEESQAVPEPTTLMGLLVMGGAGLLVKRQKSIR